MGDDAEQIRHRVSLCDGAPDPPTVILRQIERKHRVLLAVQILVDRIDGNLEAVFVSDFASPDVRSVSGEAREWCIAVDTALDLHYLRFSGLNTPAKHIAERSGDSFILVKVVRVRKSLKPSKEFREASDNLVGGLIAKVVTV